MSTQVSSIISHYYISSNHSGASQISLVSESHPSCKTKMVALRQTSIARPCIIGLNPTAKGKAQQLRITLGRLDFQGGEYDSYRPFQIFSPAGAF